MTESHVVYVVDDHYVPHLAASLRSVLDTWDCVDEPVIHVLDCGMSEESLERLRGSFPELALRLQKFDVQRVSSLPVYGDPGQVTYARFFIDDYLPDDCRRYLYLDCDTVAMKSVSSHHRIYLDGFAFAAAPEMHGVVTSNPHTLPSFRTFSIPPHQLYFNAGVLVVDRDAWRQTTFVSDALNVLAESPQLLRYGDQDALNAVTRGDFYALDPAWNCGWMWADQDYAGYNWYGDVRSRVKVAHFMGTQKPWRGNYPIPEFVDAYYASLAKTLFASPYRG